MLYEFVKGEPRRVFKLSIRNQPASECANLLLDHFPKPPGFEAAGSANRPEVAIPVASESNALSRAPETNVIPSSGWTSGVDVPKALTWFAVSLISFGILGWTIGLSIAQPIENLFAAIGIVAVLGMLIVAVIVFRRFFPSAVPKAIKAMRRQLFAPINGDRRKTRTWVAGTTFCGFRTWISIWLSTRQFHGGFYNRVVIDLRYPVYISYHNHRPYLDFP